jgi:hypothetical protein
MFFFSNVIAEECHHRVSTRESVTIETTVILYITTVILYITTVILYITTVGTSLSLLLF